MQSKDMKIDATAEGQDVMTIGIVAENEIEEFYLRLFVSSVNRDGHSLRVTMTDSCCMPTRKNALGEETFSAVVYEPIKSCIGEGNEPFGNIKELTIRSWKEDDDA